MELTLKQFILGLIVLFAIILGIRLLWAKVVYKDWRCAVAECRIMKGNSK